MQRVRQQVGLAQQISQKWNGEGITAAILDTGICLHPDFDNRILLFRDFVNRREADKCYDDSGHGTHVAGCLAGNGRLSEGKYAGIAPKAGLVIGKVLDRKGNGSVTSMLEGIEWILDNKDRYKIRILNISVGVGNIEDEEFEKKLYHAVEYLWKQGIVVVAAAGNNGPAPMTISPIATSQYVITVGCHDGNLKSDHLCEHYSGRGPTKSSIKKPDIVAPGTDIISCNGGLKWNGRKYLFPYIKKCGTSMATPIVAGACALVLQKKESMTNEEVKRKLLNSADDLNEAWSKQGWGMLNIGRLLKN